MAETQEPLTFEKALSRLEQIVQKLEAGDLPLDETVRLYEEGMKLSAFCKSKLEEAEKKIKALSFDEETGEVEVEDLDLPDLEL
ncbi:MAG: exodeoxyribonuclease VII small subunit [Armatimonadetes bacterium]|nr:exodeoxyribonuclease VII small subunit [Armatimonadota bacterium]MDW8121303.1 exodeoxyribonuclease VII small subunit [Armatimonadota bacterium]